MVMFSTQQRVTQAKRGQRDGSIGRLAPLSVPLLDVPRERGDRRLWTAAGEHRRVRAGRGWAEQARTARYACAGRLLSPERLIL